MADKPILFSTPMVKAILEGRKTQTRRLMQPQLEDCSGKHAEYSEAIWRDEPMQLIESKTDNGYWYCALCGNGAGYKNKFHGVKCRWQVGDKLYVRETFRKYYHVDEHGYTHFDKEILEYAADSPPMIYQMDGDGCIEQNKDGSEKFIPWKPSIHMPKSAARIWLEITDIRVERLQDISEEDAKAEGVELKDYFHIPADGIEYMAHSHKQAFETIWQSINGPDSWQSNPFVWVINFTVLSTHR
jgi:hypothetical protein